jgi:mannose-6-phosphate isomerase
MTTRPVRLEPSHRAKIWGKRQLGPWYPDSPEPIGEIWFLHSEELPLLVKFLFTSEKLSVQVHPADGEDGPRGKTEMWHILAAEPGAALALGFKEPITRERAREASLSGEIEHLIEWFPVQPGETYFTPVHTVHAIGAGIVLCEIQQNSDITYRLFDYGRPRPLQLEQSLAVADLGRHPGASPTDPETGLVVECPYFATGVVEIRGGESRPIEARSCHLWICIGGTAQIGCETVRAGECWLVEGESEVRSGSGARFLRTYVP